MTASDVRDTSIAPSGVVMHAIGRVGNELLIRHRSDWKDYVSKLSSINWSRNNPEWEGRVLIQDKISKSHTSILLASALIKQKIGLEADTAELSAEANADIRI
jgi:DNA sulfur modification protein DndB